MPGASRSGAQASSPSPSSPSSPRAFGARRGGAGAGAASASAKSRRRGEGGSVGGAHASVLGLALVALVVALGISPRLTAAGLAIVALRALRLYPRKVIDISWRDLLAALYYTLGLPGGVLRGERGKRERATLEASVAALWLRPLPSQSAAAPRRDGSGDGGAGECEGGPLVCLSVRTAVDLALSKLALPRGSEVIFAPGVTIPAMVGIFESHGLIAVGIDPPSAGRLLPPSLEPYITENTRAVVVTHLFGAVLDASSLICEARQRGLFVFEDLAQSFLGPSSSSPPAQGPGAGGSRGDGRSDRGGVQCHATMLARGFRGHAEADLSIASFGFIKTNTTLGGAVGWVRDPKLLEGMSALQATYSVRSPLLYFITVLKAAFFKFAGGPYLWGLVAALVSAMGSEFDDFVVRSVRGFPKPSEYRKRPSMPLLRLMERRLSETLGAAAGVAGAHDRGAGAAPQTSSVGSAAAAGTRSAAGPCGGRSGTRRGAGAGVGARSSELGGALARRLTAAGVEVVCRDEAFCSWWLFPVLDDDPAGLVQGLVARGFDATCSSTQLRAIGAAPGAADRCTSASTSAQSLMRKVVYLPVTPALTQQTSGDLVSALLEVRDSRASAAAGASSGAAAASAKARTSAQGWLAVLVLALSLALRPGAMTWWMPSPLTVWRALVGVLGLFASAAVACRFLGAAEELRASEELLRAMRPKSRAEGVAFWRQRSASSDAGISGLGAERVDGAVLLTGATGFVGGGVLFGILARARDLGITKVVLLIRKRSGMPAEARLTELRANPAFEELRDLFDELVVPLEGDVAEQDFAWGEGGAERPWPFEEPLRAVLHCAGDVRFDQPLRQAALSIISASLQVAQLAAHWGAKRFVFVSTAFVHAVPSANDYLQEKLVELRDLDPMELYRDAVSHGSWAERAMHELGFPNTYTFAKAITEHLVLQSCEAQGVEAHIVRPSIVCPAWAAPFAGWAGDKPSTIVAGSALLTARAVRVFRGSKFPCPAVPVDLVAEVIVDAMVGSEAKLGRKRISHAAVDASQADWLPSFSRMTQTLLQCLALRGDMSLAEAGLLLRFLRWGAEREATFWLLDLLVNRIPNSAAAFLCTACHRAVAAVLGLSDAEEAWRARCVRMRAVCKYAQLPAQYAPYSCPCYAWRFQSRLRLPEDWNPLEYTLTIHRAASAFVDGRPPATSSGGAAREFAEMRVLAPRPLWSDALQTFGMPGAPILLCFTTLAVRRGLLWMDLRITVDAASMRQLAGLKEPLVVCPTHRSVLDFVIIGLTCFQTRPMVPILQMPHVAADAEFAGLPVLGSLLATFGAFFVRRGSGGVQPDPALRAEVGRVFRKGRPLEVFLEGRRSRCRRQLRLRTGLLRALRDVAQRSVTLVPLSLSYELLPEDPSFYEEMRGCPRAPLQTMGLVRWAFRGFCGDLPSYGDVHACFGTLRAMDSSSDLCELLSEVRTELVALTTISTLHARALAEVLGLPRGEVLEALQRAGLRPFPSRLDDDGVDDGASASAPSSSASPGKGAELLGPAQRWPLALQAATLLSEHLPEQWALWLVEPVATPRTQSSGLGEGADSSAAEGPAAGDSAIAALAAMLRDAELVAERAAKRLREEGGMASVTEEHLVQQLLHDRPGEPSLPPPLARGAACIVAARLVPSAEPPASPTSAETSAAASGAAAEGSAFGAIGAAGKVAPVKPLWPAAAQRRVERQVDREALDRWGFDDTRFAAEWVDGRPAVQVTSRRYGALGGQPLFKLWDFFQNEFNVSLSVRDTLPDLPLPALPEPAEGLLDTLRAAVPEARVCSDAESRLRAGTGHGLADIWRLRTREAGRRFPDVVVRPECEDEVHCILKAAAAAAEAGDGPGFAVIPVGGRTNVTSATQCPTAEVDPRPFVSLDMRGMSRVLWVNVEDGVACIEAGITGSALKESLRQHGVTMGMEPDSMELSTLGGWISTRASGMKRARYGNIEDMLVQARIATPGGMLWQHDGTAARAAAPGAGAAGSSVALPRTAFGRVSTNTALNGLVLGSEGCLGVITSAIVRVKPLPEAVEYQSVLFTDWESGAAWMRDVARLPSALRPASCRLMDSRQLALSRAIRAGASVSSSSSSAPPPPPGTSSQPSSSSGASRGGPGAGSRSDVEAAGVKSALRDGLALAKRSLEALVLRAKGVRLEEAAAATLVFEGAAAEVAAQRRALAPLVRRAGGIWGGGSSGEAGYALTFAIAYLRDFCLDYRMLCESMETMVPWSSVSKVWPAVVAAIEAEHVALHLPGRPFLSCRMTQLYDEGAVLYMYMAVCTAGLTPACALHAFERVEQAAREAVLATGGCLSHHHGVGKLRAEYLAQTQSPELTETLRRLKWSMDPNNVFAARNGAWALPAEAPAPKMDRPSG